MKHIVSFSGGKDSTAMLLRMIELGMQIDEIRYVDMETWEFPKMKFHINQVEEFIQRPINKIKLRKSPDYYFFKIKTKSGNKGYGFARVTCRWCMNQKKHALDKGILKNDFNYIGYSSDEILRMNRLLPLKRYKTIYPLIKWGWSEKDSLEYCYLKGFKWGGLYEIFNRVSCWCCPFQGLYELRNLRKFFPELWNRLLYMQENTWTTFKMDGLTVYDLEKRFTEEDKQMELGI